MTALPPPPPPPSSTGSGASGGVPARRASAGGLSGDYFVASWGRRTVATAIDFVLTFLVPLHFITYTVPAYIVVAVLVAANSVYLQARTQRSVGKMAAGVFLAQRTGETSTDYPTYLQCVLRILVHLIEFNLLIGLLRPLWNPLGRTWGDSAATTLVLVGRPQGLR